MCVHDADFKFVACPPSLVAGACVSAAVSGLKGESWCRAARIDAVLRDVTSADTVSFRWELMLKLSVFVQQLFMVLFANNERLDLVSVLANSGRSKKHYNALDTRKLCYRKDDRAMRPIYRCPENFGESLTTPTPHCLQNF